MKFFASGPKPQPPKPVSLSDLAENIIAVRQKRDEDVAVAEQKYAQALAEVEADKQDAINKLSGPTQSPYSPEAIKKMRNAQATLSPYAAPEMQSELEAISKP